MEAADDTRSALLCNIQRFSVHDGPGARSVVFMKGCNLRCAWCHNPESINPNPELLFYAERCIGCGKCFAVCPSGAHVTREGRHIVDRERCVNCLRCADTCYAQALAVSGERVTVDELARQIVEEKPYYGSEGGVTFSGGESMLRIDFLEQILARCAKERVHCAIDTAGNVPWRSFERALAFSPMFLYDIKAADPQTHRRLTGADNARILENLARLSESGARIWIRAPYIPGFNHGEARAIADICSRVNAERVEIVGYHRLGESKYAALGRSGGIDPEPPSRAELEAVRDAFAERGVDAFI
ncbi:MAG: glycyl-radical enzyme activating protein [Oscillospiraceae bacterium]|nr:glycyl-radical enzyme activating protein [Oscillospiraceae bacterium]